MIKLEVTFSFGGNKYLLESKDYVLIYKKICIIGFFGEDLDHCTCLILLYILNLFFFDNFYFI